MSSPSPTLSDAPTKTSWQRAVATGAGAVALVTLVVLAFLWPTVTSEPRRVPIAVAGDAAQVEQIEASIAENIPGGFEIVRAVDRDGAVDLIESRDVYGAIVVADGATPEILETTAGSPVVAQSLTALADTLQAQLQAAADQQAAAAGSGAPTVTVAVTDVVPLAASDSRGTGLTAAMFPLLMGGMLGGIVLSITVHGFSRRLVGLAVYSLAGGFALTTVLHTWFEILQGSYVENVAVFTLSLSAIAATIVGAASLVGRAGIAVGPVLFMLFANPISSAASPVEFLPSPWGTIGQWFPPGASAKLVRDVSYFPDVNSGMQWSVLAAWTLLGCALVGIGAARHRAQTRQARPDLKPTA